MEPRKTPARRGNGNTPTPPLLFVDIDGPLNPYLANPRSARRDEYVVSRLNGIQVRLHPTHGPTLLDLPFNLVWASTWEHDANLWIAPALGLPQLPVCEFPDTGTTPAGLYFKTPTIVEYAANHPFAWIDDEITDTDREWVAQRHEGPALLRWVDPAIGLESTDFEALQTWAETLTSAT